MSFIKRLLPLVLMVALPLVEAFGAEGFVVKKIRVEGLQRISLGTVLSYLPIKPGDELEPTETGDIISALYRTGFFTDVKLARQGDDLVISVVERPTIGVIHISGNKKVPTKKLKEVLKNIGIDEGNAFDSSTLSALQESLQQQYYNLGYYNAKVTTSVTTEARDRTAVNIHIYEGKAATIKEIRIIGNHAFTQRELVRKFKLTTPRPWSFFTHDDQYSRDKLDADLETLRSFYMDKGYVRFKVNSSEASLSQDKESVHIIINITEGDRYTIQGYKLSGNLLGNEAILHKFVDANIKPGDSFSRQKIIDITNAMTRYYGDQGYAFATVNPVPTINDNNHTVFINFIVTPGQRVYVRRITFTGNSKTQDYVLRREMRQSEGGQYTVSGIEEGKRRLSNLGYLQNVQTKLTPVPGQANQVDVNYDVSEMSSATASVQAGYSDAYGFLYGANVSENNLMGTGKQVSLGFENSQYSNVASLSYVNPYYTESGISRGITIFSQHTTPGKVNLTPYTTNIVGATVTYGLPISEYSGINFGYGYQNMSLTVYNKPQLINGQWVTVPTSTVLNDFVNEHGTTFNNVTLTGGWQRTTYDKVLLPTSGSKQQISLEAGVPVMDRNLEYYLTSYQAALYKPLINNFILHLGATVGYGNGYGNYKQLPFFKNYFAGGIDSIAGYEANTLGPIDSLGRPFGGNFLTTATAGLIIPNPWSDKFRPSLFVDAGNVFQTDNVSSGSLLQNRFSFGKIKYSVGLGIQFYVPMVGPLEMAVAEPLNHDKYDQADRFQFSVGTSF